MARRFLTEEEKSLWQEVNKETKPLQKNIIESFPSPLPPKMTPYSPPRSFPYHPPAGVKFHQKPGGEIEKLDRKTHRKIQRGRLEIEGRLDLHGLFQEEAYQRLCKFIVDAAQKRKRLVLVITGKGSQKSGNDFIKSSGVLREKVPHWLHNKYLFPNVSSIHVAHQKDGGEGAFYVFLSFS